MAPSVLSPAGLHVDPVTGVMTGATGHYAKRLSDLSGVYADEAARQRQAAEDADRIAYEVYDHRGDERCGDLIFGTSVLYPGRIGREYAMTRGHLHRLPDRTEIYHCLRGYGLLLMQTVPGDVRIVELTPGAIAYVAAHWIHRSVNVGGEPLITVFCYPGDSGQDYDIIGWSGGMRRLVVDDGAGGWTVVDNPRWQPPAVIGA